MGNERVSAMNGQEDGEGERGKSGEGGKGLTRT